MTTTKKTDSKKSTTTKNQKEGTTMKNKKTASEKFVEVANIRVPKAVRRLETIAALADRSKYDYTDKQAAKIKQALQDALNELTAKFEAGEKVENTVFKL
ncbi:hypothetical protein [Endozoicomonas sp. SESOKO1]|uniref:hypothetical protein n=1 Tax=Endozoicomonas sp. SESOKO1 TaxID=2828742 RepID=UPI002148E6C9|nr:hypothetical protein [Endozoicomonas sp. SESOKO1]